MQRKAWREHVCERGRNDEGSGREGGGWGGRAAKVQEGYLLKLGRKI